MRSLENEGLANATREAHLENLFMFFAQRVVLCILDCLYRLKRRRMASRRRAKVEIPKILANTFKLIELKKPTGL